MNNSNSSSNRTSPRATLKLKIGARKSPRESKAAPVPGPQGNSKQKSGAHWSDEYKERPIRQRRLPQTSQAISHDAIDEPEGQLLG